MTAVDLRARFRNIPKPERDAHQDFAIRVWRALSWLERAESMEASDYEGRFISCWIAFNAVYGRHGDDGHPWGDREALGVFLAQVWRLDGSQRLHRVLGTSVDTYLVHQNLDKGSTRFDRIECNHER